MAKCVECKFQGKWMRKGINNSATIYADGISQQGMLYMKCKSSNPPTTDWISEREANKDEPCNSFESKLIKNADDDYKEKSYNVIFKGEISAGNSINEVKKRLSISLKTDEKKLNQLFSGNTLIIKKNTDYQTAIKYKSAFEKNGAICEIEEISDEKQSDSGSVYGNSDDKETKNHSKNVAINKAKIIRYLIFGIISFSCVLYGGSILFKKGGPLPSNLVMITAIVIFLIGLVFSVLFLKETYRLEILDHLKKHPGILAFLSFISYLLLPFITKNYPEVSINGIQSLSRTGSKIWAQILTYLLPILYLISLISIFSEAKKNFFYSLLGCLCVYGAWLITFNSLTHAYHLSWGSWISIIALIYAVHAIIKHNDYCNNDKLEDVKISRDSDSEKSEKNNTAISSAASSIETHLQQHLANMKLTYSARKSISTVSLLWDKLLRQDILLFTINTIDQELRRSIDDKTHHFRCNKFNNLYLCVSTVPCSDLKKAGSFFINGYLNFLNSVVYEANFQPGNSQGFDLAHWIFCYGAENRDARASVHLSFFPGNKIAFAVLAQDLMTPEEKLTAGL
ncbi:MAG: hypothetical protein GY749_20500 [Desulfobacteraceae bacterium]|nr:hypothetical protein [Desulfobacteraceae bacterium]